MTRSFLVVPYDPAWPARFDAETRRLQQTLGKLLLACHHVGSTSVPGLCAKPVIDIILVVGDLGAITPVLEALGYKAKGALNIPFRLYFSKEDVHIHAYEPGHPEIALNLLFRDYLRAHAEDRDAYGRLKTHLAKDKDALTREGRFPRYTLGKDAFIREILEKAGFDRLCLRVCTHAYEWERYHALRKEHLFARAGIPYDPHHPSISDPRVTHFVLSHGTRIVSVAGIEFLSVREAALRTFVTDPAFQNKGFAGHMLGLLEKWTKAQGRSVLKFHAWEDAVSFYKKRGYKEMSFDEETPSARHVNLGKIL